MIEQLIDSGVTGGGAGDGFLMSNEKQLQVIVKKQALRDLPNGNNVNITKSIDESTFQKERKDSDKVSGSKRLSSEVNPLQSQVPSAVSTNTNLVYVRRKTEAEIGKISSSEVAGNNTDAHLSDKAPVSNERVQPSSTLNKPQTDAGNISHSSESSLNSHSLPINLQNESPCIVPPKPGMPFSEDTCRLPQLAGKLSNTVSSIENKSLLTHPVGISGNTVSSFENKSPHPHPVGISNNSISPTNDKAQLQPLGKSSNIISATEIKSLAPRPLGSSDTTASMEIRSVNNHIFPACTTTKVDASMELISKPLQQWHVQPRVSLRGLDRSAHGEYLQMLRSLPSVELSQLAFELEARSIKLSLEEAREMARVEMLNVMGKSSKPSKSPIALPEK